MAARSNATSRSRERGNRTPEGVRNKLSAQLLAAAGATCAEYLAATDGLLAGEETVATGTHEIAGLESTLHDNTWFK